MVLPNVTERSINQNLYLLAGKHYPDLNIEQLKTSKHLLIGAGTLGCSVARCLLGWGITHIDFIDCGKVSLSNPLRQSLYLFEDIGVAKAIAAPYRLKQINPFCVSKGIEMTVCMPGHHVYGAEMKETIDDAKRLIEEVKSHDVIWCLTDNKESRWAPTVIGIAEGKIVISIGLGIDQFVVTVTDANDRGGCFFCNDVVGPSNSVEGKSPEERCSIVRAGLSNIASSYAVEMMVERLQPKAFTSDETVKPSILRGFLSDFRLIRTHLSPYKCCSACSQPILDEYKTYGIFFLIKVCNQEHYIETLSGLEKELTQIAQETCDLACDTEGDSEGESE